MATRAHEVHLGRLIEDGDQLRDAVHIAVAPMTAGEDLEPGDHVCVLHGDMGVAWSISPTMGAIGVVDPYLKATVRAGERFWLFLMPNTITSLRHEWTHPDFEPRAADDVRALSWEWLRDHEDIYRFVAEDLVEAVAANEDFCFGDDDGPSWARTATFWHHMEILTGRRFDAEHRDNTYFRCAC